MPPLSTRAPTHIIEYCGHLANYLALRENSYFQMSFKFHRLLPQYSSTVCGCLIGLHNKYVKSIRDNQLMAKQ